jgi:D-alanyl-D-alanine carboxypeptidase (penicillin-binding protein 5/6)
MMVGLPQRRAGMDRRAVVALIICCLFGCGALIGGTRAALAAPGPRPGEPVQTSAPHAILIEAQTGIVLFEKQADELVHPASLSKLMTAEVVFNEIRQGRLKLTDEFVVSVNAWRTGGAPSRTSSMFAPVNSRVNVQDLIQGLIIQSGNDACIVLAEGIAGSEEKFAEMMTRRARQIGLPKSTFGNSNGLPHPDQLMTARELAKLAQHIIRTYPEFYSYYGEREFTYNKIRQHNRNPLLGMDIGADGLKTGYIKEAGYGLVGSAVQHGLRLIVVVSGLKTAKERGEEARKLLEWGFVNFITMPIFEEGQVVAQAKVYGGDQGQVRLVTQRPLAVIVSRTTKERFSARVTYSGPVPAPVRKGQEVGTLKVWRGDVLVTQMPLMAADDVGVGSMSGRAWDAASELVIGLFRAGMQRL